MQPVRLLSVLARDPREFSARVAAIADSRLEPYVRTRPRYDSRTWSEALEILSKSLGTNLQGFCEEPGVVESEREIADKLASLPQHAPFRFSHNGDLHLARLCYAVARATQPETVIETGVCYGVTSSFILKALAANERGILYSIDLPPLGKNADEFVGCLVPPELRSRWELLRGQSKNILPKLLREAQVPDLFVHDSLHTYRNMRMEFDLAWPKLRPGGVLVADDVEGNASFLELTASTDVACSVVVQEQNKNSLFGVAVKQK